MKTESPYSTLTTGEHHPVALAYRQLSRRKRSMLLLVLVGLLVLFFVDILTGPAWLSGKEVFNAIVNPDDVSPNTRVIVWVMRLPIATMALVAGAALGVAGVEMQSVLNNPLASPYTLGISSAASFGAALAILYGGQVAGSLVIVPLSAFAFAILSALLVNWITHWRHGGIHTIILTGVTFSFLFTSLLAFLQYTAREHELQAIVFWMFGSLQGATWNQVAVVAATLLLTLPWLTINAWKLTALKFGDAKVKSMGVRINRLRLAILFLVSVLTAVSVCFIGVIGFVGLVAPHLARVVTGEDQRFLLPGAALFGAVMLSFSSIASKLLVQGAIFPVGITTSLIGVPFLLFVIFKTKRPGA